MPRPVLVTKNDIAATGVGISCACADIAASNVVTMRE